MPFGTFIRRIDTAHVCAHAQCTQNTARSTACRCRMYRCPMNVFILCQLILRLCANADEHTIDRNRLTISAKISRNHDARLSLSCIRYLSFVHANAHAQFTVWFPVLVALSVSFCRTLTATLVLFLLWIDRIQLNVYDKMLALRDDFHHVPFQQICKTKSAPLSGLHCHAGATVSYLFFQ